MNKLFTLFLLFMISQLSLAAVDRYELTIQSDKVSLADSLSTNLYALNGHDEVIQINKGDSAWLVFFNNELLEHYLVLGIDTLEMLPGHRDSILYTSESIGVEFIYDVECAYMGLKLALVTVDRSKMNYVWSIRSLQKSLNDTYAEDTSIDQSKYQPDHFLINRKWGMHINQDSSLRVTGQVGDSIYLTIANIGLSVHSLHFHGYHPEIIQSSKFSNHKGRSKDTFPIYPNESLILLIVPDKPGEYPVHDHNLVATTGNSLYGNGMFTTMLIHE